MILPQRINLLIKLRKFIEANTSEWQEIKLQAERENPWFHQPFIELALNHICNEFLQEEKLVEWANKYSIKNETKNPKKVGIVMAGNIPLVGFHDWLCIFISGHHSIIKTSSKDTILIEFLLKQLIEWNSEVQSNIQFAENLKKCDAYIATGSNNSSRYFDFYFGKYPNIIRRNRTSVAVLTGNETTEELQLLANDIQLYFGLGCRNVTKLYVPENYDFLKLLNALKTYEEFIDFHKYKHNYDYQLALLMMNQKFYMNNGSIILSENNSLFSAISHLHYEYYKNIEELTKSLFENNAIQCIVGKGFTPFGKAQQPSLTDYADGIDTMQFLSTL
jgi:hypothetical protein